jgi:hypothetical protein
MMSCLNLTRRPTVVFDATNVEHRKTVEQFLRTGTWGRTDVNFLLETPYYDLPAMITAKLTDYYLRCEFTSSKGKKTQIQVL